MNRELDHKRSAVVLRSSEARSMGNLKTLLRNANEIKATENARRLERRIRRIRNLAEKRTLV